MAITYDLTSQLQRESLQVKIDYLVKQGATVRLSEIKPTRSLRQNSYLHLILSFFGVEVGEDLDTVKRVYYKATANADLYVRYRDTKLRGIVSYLRSSRELTTEEMTTSIERFRNWSAQEAGIYLPSPDDRDALFQLQQVVNRNKEYL